MLFVIEVASVEVFTKESVLEGDSASDFDGLMRDFVDASNLEDFIFVSTLEGDSNFASASKGNFVSASNSEDFILASASKGNFVFASTSKGNFVSASNSEDLILASDSEVASVINLLEFKRELVAEGTVVSKFEKLGLTVEIKLDSNFEVNEVDRILSVADRDASIVDRVIAVLDGKEFPFRLVLVSLTSYFIEVASILPLEDASLLALEDVSIFDTDFASLFDVASIFVKDVV
uniref:Candidate secreted effector n=1 Tax=Meloidogyne incognita TaxID=6306 RepID=A0A914L5V8_MELIC